MSQTSQLGRTRLTKIGAIKQKPSHILTQTEQRKVKLLMAQVNIKQAAAAAGLPDDLYHNVMAGRSRNMTDFNKILIAAKKILKSRERLAV